MDNAQKAIMIGVGLFITIIIISAVLLIVNLGTGLVDDATSELSTMSSSLQSQILQTYDNKDLSGVQARSAVQQYLKSTDMVVVLLGKNADVPVIAATVGNTKNVQTVKFDSHGGAFTVTANDYKDDENDVHETAMSEFTNVANAGLTYIEPTGAYKSYVLKVENTQTVVGIVIQPSDLVLPTSNEVSEP